jgi:thiamine-phosphate pyrophosphorylase
MVLTLLKPSVGRGVYVISHSVDVLVDASRRGAALIQLRDKSASKSDIYRRAVELMTYRDAISIPIIINDHIDIAIAVGADGVHSGQDEMPIEIQRDLLGPHKLIGRTTHSMAEGQIAQSAGADYVSVGPIWETPSKPGRQGIGLDYLSQANRLLTIPFVAIGGVDESNVAALARFNPPLIGIIRAMDQLEVIQAAMGIDSVSH